MKLKNLLYIVPLLALVAYGCENVDEPFSIEDGAVPAFVIIETTDQAVTAGSSLEVDFQLGQTQAQNVTVEYSISGDAVAGEDYEIIGGSAGTVVIEHDSTSTNLDRGTVTLAFPATAALGTARELTFTLESATTASGEELSLGRGDTGLTRTYQINGLRDEIQTGTYDYTFTGDFGDSDGTVEIAKPDEPIMVGGSPYFFTVSNIADGLFGTPVLYAFNVTAGGGVVGAPNAHEEGFTTIIADVGGSYSEGDATTITFEVTLQCCGVAGAQYLVSGTLQE